MRKILSVLLVLTLFTGIASAESVKVGILSKLNLTEEEYSTLINSERNSGFLGLFTSKPAPESIAFKFYDSLMAMQMGLNAGEVNEIILPEAVAEYIMNTTGNYKVSSIARTRPAYLAFGFNSDEAGKALAAKFNEAILSMKTDGTLTVLQGKYIYEPGLDEPEAIEFRKLENVDKKITVAVTGDLPPIDYVTADGKAAGFNTAVIAEIGKRLNVNIEIIDITAGARASAVTSGRADAVFWIQGEKGSARQADIPEGMIISEPYYVWNEFLFLEAMR